MKTHITLLFLFLTTTCFAQIDDTSIVRITRIVDYRPAKIIVLKDDAEISTIQLNTGRVRYRNLSPGFYRIVVKGKENITDMMDSVFVKDGQLVEIKISGPCLYDRPVDYLPVCPRGHTDSIITIIYGLIGELPNSTGEKKREFYAGGCVVTDCDPKFYCTLHEEKF